MAYLKIGELSKQTGLAVGNLRYYSDLGLLQPVQRGNNGYRYYSQDATKQVEFIKKAQALGFTLEEIKQILDVAIPRKEPLCELVQGEGLGERGEKPCSLVKSLLSDKIEQLEIQIKQMTLFKMELEEYRTSWANSPNPEPQSQEVCPLISSVSLHSASSN